MLTAETVHAEGARYTASIVCAPGLWATAAVWRGVAGFLGHRGWECHLLDACGMPGGIGARARAVADYLGALPAPAILLAHDAGAAVALATAERAPVAALVLLAPLLPGTRAARRLAFAPRRLLPLVVGGMVPAPAENPSWLDAPDPVRGSVLRGLRADDAGSVRDVLWGRVAARPSAAVPTLVVAGSHDRLVPADATEPLARAIGAERRALEGGHWLLAGPGWQDIIAVVHRWLVQRLGAPLLELYPEAMAEREDGEG